MMSDEPKVSLRERPDARGSTEGSRKHLIPYLPGHDPRRNQGGSWPGWRRALYKVVGDGEVLYRKLHDLAMGVPQRPLGEDGQPMQEVVRDIKGKVVGTRDLILQVPPMVQRQAAAELLDRAFGKPVQVVLDMTPADSGAGDYVPSSELTEDERAILRNIAKRRMLVQRVTGQDPEPAPEDGDQT